MKDFLALQVRQVEAANIVEEGQRLEVTPLKEPLILPYLKARLPVPYQRMRHLINLLLLMIRLRS